MKKVLLIFLLLLPIIVACNNKSVFYNEIEKINDNYSFKLFIYGEEITKEKHAEALPDNLNYEYIKSLDDKLDFDGIYVLLITKDVNDEEMAKLNVMFMNNVNILFYDITNYRDMFLSKDYDYSDYYKPSERSTSVILYKSKGPYIARNDEPNIWRAFDLIMEMLKRYA